MSLNRYAGPELAPVGFYVHHHGSGHATRCKQIAALWPDASPIHIFTSAPHYFAEWQGGTVHELPMDTEEGRDPSRDMLERKVLHYAPTGLRAVSERMATIANWIAQSDPKVFIVDLSCEIALFARLCGAKVALVRLNGFRRDPAHVAAFQLADVLLAPFPGCLEDEHTQDWVREKTIYLGMFSRYDARKDTKADSRKRIGYQDSRKLVTVVNGSGGGVRALAYWEQVARLNPDYHFQLLGQLDREASTEDNVSVVGYVSDTFPYLKAADLIIGSGGTNTMSEVGAANGRFISLPEPRPFYEQVYKMQALEKLGLTRAIQLDVSPSEWAKWLRRAGDLQPSRWRRVRNSTKFSNAVMALARRYSGEGISTPASVNQFLFGMPEDS